jgi:hypothetical protein
MAPLPAAASTSALQQVTSLIPSTSCNGKNNEEIVIKGLEAEGTRTYLHCYNRKKTYWPRLFGKI